MCKSKIFTGEIEGKEISGLCFDDKIDRWRVWKWKVGEKGKLMLCQKGLKK